ncbi:MAG TPA: CAP domain-containing protein [Bacillales bacterium]|nr:CAP domain-containing protein [Bacillales bacterium]
MPGSTSPGQSMQESISSSHKKANQPDKPSHVSKYKLSELIGMSGKQVKKKFGKPSRIDPSAYGYDWWVYNRDRAHYMQIGVDAGKVVSVFAFGKKLNTGPFVIGKKAKDVLKGTSLDSTVSLKTGGGSYRFELSEEELNKRPLIPLGHSWAILYFDQFTKKLVGIRYVDGKTLVKLKPYSFSYRGTLTKAKELNRKEWKPVEQGEEKEILEMTNIIRQRYGVGSLKWNEKAAHAAFGHSKEMAVKHYFSHTSPTAGSLGNRLHQAGVHYWQAGENIAAHYPDGIAAMFGWLNSKGHRENLLHKAYSGLGVGVYEKYYTQDFVRPF